MRHSLKELPAAERPRERLLEVGPAALSDGELLAVLLRTGVPGKTAVTLANELLRDWGGLVGLCQVSPHQLRSVKGLGPAKAAQVLAALEISRRISSRSPSEGRPRISEPAAAANLLMESMRHLNREHFQVLLLNTKNQLLAIEEISVGSLNASIVHPREVFAAAVRRSAHALILAHNHPSGDPTPSPEDRAVTRRLVEAGRLLGIEVLDHVIIGDNRWVSLREQGLEWS